MASQFPARAGLTIVEPTFIPDTHITGVAGFSKIAGNLRISCYVERPVFGLVPKEGIIVAHLVMSIETFMVAFEQANREVYQKEIARCH